MSDEPEAPPEAFSAPPRVAEILAADVVDGMYPRLLWDEYGTEVTVHNKHDHARLVAAGHRESA